MMAVSTLNLFGLPDELLLAIVSHLEREDLLTVLLTAKRLKNLAEPLLFEHFDISRGEHARALFRCMSLDLQRAKWLKFLLVSTRHGEDQSLTQLPHLLQAAVNLRRLTLETPDCNRKAPVDRICWINLQKEYEAVLANATVTTPPGLRSLPNLESFQMHFVDENKSLYRLTKYSSIFLHPNLKSLTISCACTDWADQLLAPYQGHYYRTTNLQHLHLEECDISTQSLEVLLSFPKGLKSLVISEGARYDRGFGPGTEGARLHGNVLPQHLANALTQSSAHSLESVSLDLGWKARRLPSGTFEPPTLDLTGLYALKHLELSSKTATNMLFTRPTCDHRTFRLLPSCLESLKIFGLSPYSLPPFRRSLLGLGPQQDCILADAVRHGVPSLKTLTWSYRYENLESERNGLQGLVRRIAGDEALYTTVRQLEATRSFLISFCESKLQSYRRAGVRVRIEIVEEEEGGYIPPYLSYEPRPVTSLLWDSEPPSSITLVSQPTSKETESVHKPDKQTFPPSPTEESPAQGQPMVMADTDPNEVIMAVNSESEDVAVAELLEDLVPGLPPAVQVILASTI